MARLPMAGLGGDPRDFGRYATEVFTNIDTKLNQPRFRILDAIAITTAFAIAIVVSQYAVATYSIDSRTAVFVYTTVTAMSITWTLAILTALSPTPLRDAAKSPGKLAVILVTLVSVLSVVRNWYLVLAPTGIPNSAPTDALAPRLLAIPINTVCESDVAAYTVAAGWITLVLTGTRNATSDWLASAGLLVGVFWIACAFTSPILLNDFVLEAMGVTKP